MLGTKRSYTAEGSGKLKKNWHEQLFREEIARQHKVVFWGKLNDGYDWTIPISEVIERYGGFDAVVVSYNLDCYNDLNGVTIPKIHITGDYYKGAHHPGYGQNLPALNQLPGPPSKPAMRKRRC